MKRLLFCEMIGCGKVGNSSRCETNSDRSISGGELSVVALPGLLLGSGADFWFQIELGGEFEAMRFKRQVSVFS